MTAVKYKLFYKKSVDKDLRKLPSNTRKNIVKKIQRLESHPHPIGSTKLRGSTNLYRFRHSAYRIIYEIKETKLVILVIKVGHRKEIYRDL